jgi:protoporphyrinogen oxidase
VTARTGKQVADVVVIGGGLAGLAAAFTAERLGASTIVLEAADEPGGLARSIRVGGYTFDCSGHLLHVARPETRSLIEEVTASDDWYEIERRSAVAIEDRFVPYPFQLHLAYAPEEVRDECLAGLPTESGEWGTDPAAVGFSDWIDASLGPGIAKHFMVPYNEKVAQVPVSELTCEWLGRFVPRPSLDDIRAGAASRRLVETGYNTRFLYPARGGIDLLWQSLAARLPAIETRARVVAVDTANRRVTTESDVQVSYKEGLVSSMPLPEMADVVNPRIPTFALGSVLRASTVTCVNLGLRALRPSFRDVQWLYLPERRFRAYRVGFYTRFAPAMSPSNREGVYVEIAHDPAADEGALVEAAVADLVELAAIESERDVEVAAPIRIDGAYVIHDRNYSWARGRIDRELAGRGIRMAGRYGRWEYAAMEDALWQGIDAAKQLLAERPETTSAEAGA